MAGQAKSAGPDTAINTLDFTTNALIFGFKNIQIWCTKIDTTSNNWHFKPLKVKFSRKFYLKPALKTLQVSPGKCAHKAMVRGHVIKSGPARIMLEGRFKNTTSAIKKGKMTAHIAIHPISQEKWKIIATCFRTVLAGC